MVRGATVARRPLVVLLAAVSIASVGCIDAPRYVDRVTIVNGTEFDLGVEVTGPDRTGWLPLALVPAGSETVVEEVADQGAMWVFRFRHWGDPVGELSIARAELERDGWRVAVPEDVGERLRGLVRQPSG